MNRSTLAAGGRWRPACSRVSVWAILPTMDDMSQYLCTVAIAIGAYLLGSINLSIAACRLLNVDDPRKQGSGNPGATNLLRTAGWKVGAPVLLLDLGKAFLAIWAAKLLGKADLAPAMALPLILGNIFPLFHRFRGGKGVAAATGAFLAIDPIAFLVGGAVFAVAVAAGRRVSVGSMAMVTSYPLTLWLTGGSQVAIATGGAVIAIVAFTHRSNISRLARGQEPRIGERDDYGKKRDAET